MSVATEAAVCCSFLPKFPHDDPFRVGGRVALETVAVTRRVERGKEMWLVRMATGDHSGQDVTQSLTDLRMTVH